MLCLATCYAAGIDRFDDKLLETRSYHLVQGRGPEENGLGNGKGIGLGYEGGKVLEIAYDRGLRNEGYGRRNDGIVGYGERNRGPGYGDERREVQGYGRRGYGETGGYDGRRGYGETSGYDGRQSYGGTGGNDGRRGYGGYGYDEGALGGYGYNGYRGYGVGYVGSEEPRILGRFGLGYDRRTYFSEGLSAPLTPQELQVVGRGYYGRLYRFQNYDYERDLKNDRILKYD